MLFVQVYKVNGVQELSNHLCCPTAPGQYGEQGLQVGHDGAKI
jgi:hypothetical protein